MFFDLVNQQELDVAIVHHEVETFDVLSHQIFSSPLVIVGHPNIDTSELDIHIRDKDMKKVQSWL